MFERASMSFTNGHCVPFGGFWVVNHVVGSLVATNENAPSNIGQYLEISLLCSGHVAISDIAILVLAS